MQEEEELPTPPDSDDEPALDDEDENLSSPPPEDDPEEDEIPLESPSPSSSVQGLRCYNIRESSFNLILRLDFPPDDFSDDDFLSLPSYHSEDEILFDELDDPDDECVIDDYGDYIDGI